MNLVKKSHRLCAISCRRIVMMFLCITCPTLLHAGDFSVGAVAANSSGEYIDSNAQSYLLPLVRYNSDSWTVTTIRAEYHLPITSNLWVDTIAAFRLQNLSDKTSDKTVGIEKRNESLDAGFSINYYLGDFGFTGVEWLHDISSTHKGNELSLLYAFPLEGPKIGITPSLFISRMSDDLVDYYYGVRTPEVRSDRPFYQGKSTTNYGASLELRYSMSRHWKLYLQSSITQLGKNITASPLVDRKNSLNSSLAVNYRF